MEAWKILLLALLAVAVAGGLFVVYSGWALADGIFNGVKSYAEAEARGRAEQAKKDAEWARKHPDPRKLTVRNGVLVAV